MVLTAACAAALTGSAVAQTSGQDILVPPSGPQPYASTSSSIFNPQPAASDAEWLRSGLSAARSGNVEQLRLAESAMVGATARKVLEWAAADIMPAGLSFAELDRARADLQAWPRKANRQAAAERALETSGLSPQEIVNWFRRQDPATPEGAMALGGALEQLGRPGDAQALIRRVWRDKAFDLDKQRLMLTRFGALLTPQDHIRRADTLLYADVGPALRDLLPLLPPEEQQTAEARIALRTGSASGEALYDALPPARQHDPGVAVERARWLYDRGRGEEALPLIADFPRNPPPDASSRFWALRRALVNVAVKVGDYADAHRAVDDHGLPPGADAADAEFLGGWLALTKLHDPADAEQHFGRLEYMGASPITISRALYWRGRAEEALGDPIAAQASYGRGARYYTAFYGQMAAAKAGLTEIVLDKDPAPTAQDRAAFESRELVQAARLLARAGANDLYRVLMIASAESLPTTADMAMLVDMADAEADPELSMRIVRLAAQRGLVLPERGYPLRRPPQTSPVEAPFVLGIIRQESGFDPSIRSGAGARGMMQLMPATARHLARRSGMRYRDSMLDDPEYNMRLGSNFLGDLVNQFDGSYVLATAAYNAGPGRPTQWTATCGDPRAAAIDPVDYIECIPISETRNYVMRVLENIQVYRARLNGGRAPLTLPADLKRGGYGQPRPYAEIAQNASAQNELAQNTLSPGASSASDRVPAWSAAIADAVASTQIPDPSESPRLIKAVHDNRADGHARLRKVALKAHHAAAHGGHHGKSRRRRS
jgi:soluble lytic murein transglycosylase